MEPRQAAPKHTPQQVLKSALTRFAPGKIAISFSGAEDVVLIDMAMRMDLPVDVFSLDTGRLHPETYRYLETVRNHYGVEVELLMPDADAVRALVQEKGLFSFYEDGHGECCAVRKIGPLRVMHALFLLVLVLSAPFAGGESARSGWAMWPTLIAPADSPKIVTLPGSPPKASTLFRTHSRAAIWSRSPQFAANPSRSLPRAGRFR